MLRIYKPKWKIYFGVVQRRAIDCVIGATIKSNILSDSLLCCVSTVVSFLNSLWNQTRNEKNYLVWIFEIPIDAVSEPLFTLNYLFQYTFFTTKNSNRLHSQNKVQGDITLEMPSLIAVCMNQVIVYEGIKEKNPVTWCLYWRSCIGPFLLLQILYRFHSSQTICLVQRRRLVLLLSQVEKRVRSINHSVLNGFGGLLLHFLSDNTILLSNSSTSKE